MAGRTQELNAADELRRIGRLIEAEVACKSILEADSNDAEAHYLYGLIAFETPAFDLAELHMARAVALIPEDPGFQCGLGIVQHTKGKLDEAAASFQIAIGLNPESSQAYANLGLVLTEVGKNQEAILILQKALSLDPDNADTLLSLGNAYLELKKFDDAINSYHHVIQVSPGYAAAYRNLGNAFSNAGQLDDAEQAYRNCLRLQPQFQEAYSDLGLVLVANGKLNEAAEHYLGAIRAFRAVEERPLESFIEFNKYNKTKLQHDIEQFDYLMARNKIPKDYAFLSQEYSDVLDRLGEQYEGLLSDLNPPASPRLLKSYNRIIYHEPGELIEGGVLSSSLNTQQIEKEFVDNPHGFTFFDGLLREEALQSLYSFCLSSTIWSLIDYKDEIEANILTGSCCPLIFQIAMDIKQAFPKILGAHPFTSCWAYKYFQRKSGLGVHCDDGAVSINFWITPDHANNNPKAGGLVLWNKKVSRDYLGEMTEEREKRFKKILAESDAESFRVPYRCNRAVLFQSNILHGTDEIDFKTGYENNRINLTFLYGKSPKKGAM